MANPIRNFIFLFITASLLSCSSEIIDNQFVAVQNTKYNIPLTRSGHPQHQYDTLPNPYRLSVMQKVYNDYSQTPIELAPTDFYVRFMPRDTVQMRKLVKDYNLELFEYPMDIVLQEGDEYINPDIPETDLAWVYTTVKPDFDFPNDIPYVILQECYIPQDGEVIVSTKGTEVDVEIAAFLSVGYNVDYIDAMTKTTVYPSGTISFQDSTLVDSLEQEIVRPVKGVKIRCHNIVKWDTTYTDENGEYSFDRSFRTNINYTLIFENDKGFNLWGNWGPIAAARYNMGWHNNEGHSTEILLTSKAWDWAAINDITYNYYAMCDTTNILAPPQDLNILVCREMGLACTPMFSKLGTDLNPNRGAFYLAFYKDDINDTFNLLVGHPSPDVVIGTSGRSYASLSGLVGHELAHASHFSQVGSAFWTRYINHIISHWGYGTGSGNDAQLCAIGEMWGYSMEQVREIDCYDGNYSKISELPPVAGWIPRMLFLDLYKGGYLTPEQVFSCLTSEVDTYYELYNKMLSMFPQKAKYIEWAFNNNGLLLDDTDNVYFPSMFNIELLEEFNIYWVYSIGTELQDVEFTFIKENYFDGSSDHNIFIFQNDFKKCMAKVQLKDYGHYVIEARIKNTDIKKYFHIIKMYRPYWSAYNPLGIEGSLPVADEPFLGTITDSTLESRHYINFGIGAPLEGRTVAVVQKNVYAQKEGGSIRIDRRSFNASSDTLTFTPRQSFVLDLPRFGIRGGEWSDEQNCCDSTSVYSYKMWDYYAVLYPDDVCYCLDDC